MNSVEHNKDPLVSIIIPTYNGTKTIQKTLQSVLSQVYKNYEIIIVDDGSSDSTVELVKTQVPTAKVIQQKNQGTLVARQTGIESAQGDLIAFLDQDDLWIPETLITEVNIFNKHPEIGLVAANMQAVDEQGNKLEFDVIPNPQSYDLSWERLLLIQPIATSTTLFRKDLVARIGGLDTSFGFSGALGDLDMFIRMSEVTNTHFHNACLGYYCWSETRPGRLVSFLDNLQVYAKKYWDHPRLKLKENFGIRTNFVQACCNYAVHIYRLLLKQYDGKIPSELLTKLNEHNIAMEDLFEDYYRTNIGLKALDLRALHSPSDGIKAVLFLYLLRRDLQETFPQAINGDLEMLITWGAQVAGGQIHDGDADILGQFVSDLALAVQDGNYKSISSGISGVDETARRRLLVKRRINLPSIIYIQSYANKLFPLGTRRRRLLSPVLRGAKVLLFEGWTSFGKKTLSFITRQIHVAVGRIRENYRDARSRFAKQKYIFDNNITESKLRILLSDMDVRFAFPKFDSPLVAIVVNADEDQQYTYECIESLAAYLRIPYRLFVIRNKATTGRRDFLTKLDNVVVIDNAIGLQNHHALYDLLRVHLKNEKYILFIKGDTVVTGGSLERMTDILDSDSGCGAVTCKLIDFSGRLAEAGELIEVEGDFVSYGSGDDPDKPEYSYVRQVHFCSTYCFMVRKSVLDGIYSGSQLIPLNADFCKFVIDSGYSIIYQPAAIVMKHNFGEIERHQVRSLSKPHTKNSFNILVSNNLKKGEKILVIDDYIPAIRYGSGFPRLYKMLTCLSDLGYFTTFFPVGNPVKVQPETLELQQMGVEVFWGNYAHFDEFVRSRAGYYDVVLISRPHVFERIYPSVIQSFPKAAILYDAEALFYARDIVKAEISGEMIQESDKTRIASKEMHLMEKADIVISVSQQTKEIILKNSLQKNIEVWEHIQDVPGSNVPFGQRQGILHFGSFFAGPGSPNEDAVLYFVQDVLPKIQRTLESTLYIVGTSPTPAVMELAASGIEVVGYVDRPKTYFDMCRVNIVPTRIFATGTPLKLIEAMSYGIPSVVNGPIARHLGLVDGREVLVADTSSEFAMKVVQLYSDESLWQSLHRSSIEYITENYSYDKMKNRLDTAIKRGLKIRSGNTSATENIGIR